MQASRNATEWKAGPLSVIRHWTSTLNPTSSPAIEFVALQLVAHAQAPLTAGDIAIELRRGTVMLNVNWLMAGAASCAAWIHEVLR